MANPSIRLRVKEDVLVADPLWWDIQQHPNSWTFTVASPQEGPHTVTIVPEEGEPVPTTYNRLGVEDAAAVASGLALRMTDNAALRLYVFRVDDVGAGVVRVVSKTIEPGAIRSRYRISTSSPLGSSIAISPDTVFPVSARVPEGVWGAEFRFRAIDGGGSELAFFNTRADISVVTVGAGPTIDGVRVGTIGRRGPFVSMELASGHSDSSLASGTQLSVALGVMSNPPANIAAVEIWVDWLRS